MKEYNGHRSWNAWNVALWIGNDYGLYEMARECIEAANGNMRKATSRMMEYTGDHTPDGAKYNHLCVKLALEGLVE